MRIKMNSPVPQNSGWVSLSPDLATKMASRSLSTSTNEKEPSHAVSAVTGWSLRSPSLSSNPRRYSSSTSLLTKHDVNAIAHTRIKINFTWRPRSEEI